MIIHEFGFFQIARVPARYKDDVACDHGTKNARLSATKPGTRRSGTHLALPHENPIPIDMTLSCAPLEVSEYSEPMNGPNLAFPAANMPQKN